MPGSHRRSWALPGPSLRRISAHSTVLAEARKAAQGLQTPPLLRKLLVGHPDLVGSGQVSMRNSPRSPNANCCRGHDANQTERIAKEVKGALFGFGMSPGPESFPHSFPRQQWFLNPECQSSRKHTVSSISSHSSQKFRRQC